MKKFLTALMLLVATTAMLIRHNLVPSLTKRFKLFPQKIQAKSKSQNCFGMVARTATC